MDAKLSHCFSSDCISADAGITDGGDLVFDPPKPPPPPLALFFCFFAACRVVIGRDRCGQVKAADWVDKKRLAKANHSSDAAIMVSIVNLEK